jgi:Kae1-associated kinase Bud32
MKGAEAVLRKTALLGIPAVVKERIPKSYRVAQLDNSLRKTRTRIEARLLHRAKIAGVACPAVLEVNEFSLTLSYIKGKRPKSDEKTLESIGTILARLHESGIVHGDFTPANLLQHGKNIYVIDFGLGFFSNDIEDRAIDVYTMLKSLRDEKTRNAFLKAYASHAKSQQVFSRLKVIEKRVRYAF